MGGGQVSVEYLVLTIFIVLVLVVPTVAFVYGVATKGVYGTIHEQRAQDLGNGLTENAKQVYYLGLYSKKVVEYNMPDRVESFFLLDLLDRRDVPEGVHNYYVGIILSQDKRQISKHLFQSSTPIVAEDSANVDVVDYETNPSITYINECSDSQIECTFYVFSNQVSKPGYKKFKLETKDPSDVKVYITPQLE